MATRAIQLARSAPGVFKATWEGLTLTDDGDAWSEEGGAASFADKTVQVVGTFGTGGAVTIEGSHTGAVGEWGTLTDASGTPLVITDISCFVVLENPMYIRPRVTGGDGTTDLTCIINGRSVLV